jgi:hypothetical protein
MMVRLRVPFGRLAACLLALLVATIPLATRAADPYEIWVIGELTGSNAFVGNQEVKGTLAIESLINKQGGINGRPIKIIVKDDQTNPQVAVQFMNEAIAAKVPFVIGGGASIRIFDIDESFSRWGLNRSFHLPATHPREEAVSDGQGYHK